MDARALPMEHKVNHNPHSGAQDHWDRCRQANIYSHDAPGDGIVGSKHYALTIGWAHQVIRGPKEICPLDR